MTRIYCDKCEKEITGDPHILRLTTTREDFEPVELCEECYSGLTVILAGFGFNKIY